MLNAAETAGVAESDSSAGSCCRSLLSDGGSPATVNLETRSVREARRSNSQGWKSYGLFRPCQMARWLDTGTEAVAGVLGLFHFYRRDEHFYAATRWPAK